jgi:uracil-DNA glycosylase family 4
MIPQQFNQQQLLAMLAWQVEMGADEAVLDTPADERAVFTMADVISGASAQAATSSSSSGALSAIETTVSGYPPSQQTLDHLTSLADLAAALEQLDACPLKHTASAMCFADGNAGARLMIIGEVPGRDEDRLGMPFVGAAGQFLDRMMASIGLDRSGVYLTNFLPWRPPGNRTPTVEETDMLLPFLFRHVQLANPKLVLVLGGAPAKVILNRGDNILKLRGRWHDIDYGDGIMRPTMASLHPSYLTRSPAQKRLAFDDWLGLYRRLATPAPPALA